jgi:hypothetical protein
MAACEKLRPESDAEHRYVRSHAERGNEKTPSLWAPGLTNRSQSAFRRRPCSRSIWPTAKGRHAGFWVSVTWGLSAGAHFARIDGAQSAKPGCAPEKNFGS